MSEKKLTPIHYDEFVKSPKTSFSVIPAKAGIQLFQDVLDPGFRRGDDLNDSLRDHHFETLIKIFQSEGFSIQRKKGDHIIMTKPGVKRPLVIKCSPRLVPVTHIRTNMTTAGINRERFFALLEEVQ